jgi:hypothetical protein
VQKLGMFIVICSALTLLGGQLATHMAAQGPSLASTVLWATAVLALALRVAFAAPEDKA